jgi:DNA polymerase/3'-5' exonuclease PolX
MNSIIISEFEKLVSFYKSDKDTSSTFRVKQLKNVLTILSKHSEIITLENYTKLKELPGIGDGTIKRIKEILETGKLIELSSFNQDKESQVNELEEVVGIGRVKALELFEKGITSIKILQEKIEKKEIEVNEKIELGLKYHGKYKINIPRDEIDKIYKLIKKIITEHNKTYSSKKEHVIFNICGSYRREKSTSGDIDVLISKQGKLEDINYLLLFVNKLKENKLLVDDITDKNFETKYMGFAQLKKNPVRRIDIRFVTYDSYYSALLYFTGSMELNKKMRNIAKSKGLKLSEYGLHKIDDNSKLNITSEEDFFKALDMEYLEPKDR